MPAVLLGAVVLLAAAATAVADDLTLVVPAAPLPPGAEVPVHVLWDNVSPRPAVQIALAFDVSAFELLSATAQGRVTPPLSMDWSLSADGFVYLLIADPTSAATSLAPGSGAIADLVFRMPPENTSYIPLDTSVLGAVAVDSTRTEVAINVITVLDSTTVAPEISDVLQFRLRQNNPNPFREATRISFSIPQREHVTLTLYDVQGRRVRRLVDGTLVPKAYETVWDGTNDDGNHVASGIYFYKLSAGNVSQTRKLVILR